MLRIGKRRNKKVARKPKRIPVLGIVGGIASGKSTVAKFLARKGAEVIYADSIGHIVLRRPDVKDAVRELFGDSIFDEAGQVSRSALAGEVFQEPSKLEALNRIVHPIIIQKIRNRIERVRHEGKAPLIVLDAALLIETGLDREFCNAVLFVDADRKTRMERAQRSRSWDNAKFAAREKAQMAPELKKARADFVVASSGSIVELEESVEKFWLLFQRRLA